MTPPLERFIILYEPEGACRDRLTACGYPTEVAAEIAFYLAQATDFEALIEPIRGRFEPIGVEVLTATLDERRRWLPWLEAPHPERTLLWCLTDGFAWYRGSLVSSVAGLWGVPQFGSPPVAQHMAQDKLRCLALAAACGVRTPPSVLVEGGEPLTPLAVLPPAGPFFVKPNTLGAKLGIGADARAGTRGEALALSRRIHRRYGDRALIQPFIAGRDVRVSFMDLGDPGASLGVAAIATGADFPTLDVSKRMTRLRRAGENDGLTLSMDSLEHSPAGAAIAEAARRIARVAGLRDYWSMDFRLADEGTPWFLELEVCPAVTIYDFLTYLRTTHGTDLPGALVRAAPLAHKRRLVEGRWW